MKNRAVRLEELELQGRENKSKEEKIRVKEIARESKATSRKVAYLDKMIALNTSPLVSALRINFFLKILFPMLWIVSLAIAYPYLVYFITGEPIIGIDYKSGTHWRLDPAEEGYAMLWPFAIMTSLLVIYGILWLIASATAHVYLAREFEWLKSLPFPMLGYPGVLESDFRNRFEVSIHYRTRRPDNSFIDRVIRGFNEELEYSRRDSVDMLKMDFNSEWRPSSKSAFKFHKILHKLCDIVLIPLHKEYPIDNLMAEW